MRWFISYIFSVNMNINIYINWFNTNIILDINIVHSGGITGYFTLVVTGIFLTMW